ncbi:hypothetical protein AB0N62_44020 [Streptomyces sp. NPDC093982]|uniref:hypothetical protein n=1 Tax=Streptomyces sp. NPDC093982 TaxID=3155077 RepID=UPI00341FE7F2
MVLRDHHLISDLVHGHKPASVVIVLDQPSPKVDVRRGYLLRLSRAAQRCVAPDPGQAVGRRQLASGGYL